MRVVTAEVGNERGGRLTSGTYIGGGGEADKAGSDGSHDAEDNAKGGRDNGGTCACVCACASAAGKDGKDSRWEGVDGKKDGNVDKGR